MGYEDWNEDAKEGAGCLIVFLLSLMVMAAAFVIGGLFGWFWGVGFYFGAMSLFGLWIVGSAIKAD